MSGEYYIPLVPFASLSGYEDMLACLIQEYQNMMLKGLSIARLLVSGWCQFYESLSWGFKAHWLKHSEKLFLELTKGCGKDWCESMNTMVVDKLRYVVRTTVTIGDRKLGLPLQESCNGELVLSISRPWKVHLSV